MSNKFNTALSWEEFYNTYKNSWLTYKQLHGKRYFKNKDKARRRRDDIIKVNIWDMFWDREYMWLTKYVVTPSGRKIKKMLCKCICWKEEYVQRQHLLNGESKNCWCKKQENIKKYRLWRVDVLSEDEKRMRRVYHGIQKRCYNKKCRSFKNYWLRWIVCVWENFDSFKKDMYESFLEHVEKYWRDNTTIERIDVNWNYCKENCKRATRLEQANNKTTTHKVCYKWKRYNSISDLARDVWVKYGLIRDRIIKQKYDIDKAVESPIKKWTEVCYNNKKYQSLSSLAKEVWINTWTLCMRLKKWVDIKEAVKKTKQ